MRAEAKTPRAFPALTAFRTIFFAGLLAHFLPSLIFFDENYSAGAFRVDSWNTWLYGLFPLIPQPVVAGIGILACGACLVALAGRWVRTCSVIAGLGFYFLASINSFRVNAVVLTDAWAILAIFALFGAPKRKELCRQLILIQVFAALFAAGVQKLLAGWPFGNEMHVLLSSPPGLMARSWVGSVDALRTESVGWVLSVLVPSLELSIPVLAFFRKTRRLAAVLGLGFFFGLSLTMDVPWLFFVVYFGGALLLAGEEARAGGPSLKKKQRRRLKIKSRVERDGLR